jgi:hypothetical protein
MKNPSLTVSSFLPQNPGTPLSVKTHTHIYQLHDPDRTLIDQDLYNISVTKPGSCPQGILQMQKW